MSFFDGTLILTPFGEVPVETLSAGGLVLAADGGAQRLLWIARRAISRRFADPVRFCPVRISAGAIGEGVPNQDLVLSPCHAILVAGVLVQAGALVNGLTITREFETPPTWNYFHLEIERQGLVIAGGVASESFIENTDCMAFDNLRERRPLFSESRKPRQLGYPRVRARRHVPLWLRQNIAQRAALRRLAD